MMKFIFEDNPDMTLCFLLKHCYNNSNLYFSLGNTNLFSKLCEIYNDDDEFYIFLDYNCRQKLYDVYYRLVATICSKYDFPDNVFIIHIPSLEYILLKMLDTYSYVTDTGIKSVLNFNRSVLSSLSTGGFENSIKKYLSSLGDEFLNYNLSSSKYNYRFDKIRGSFYHETTIPNIRSERFYTSLPVFDDLEEIDNYYLSILSSYAIQTNKISKNDLNIKQQNFFEDMAMKLGREIKSISIFCNGVVNN